MGNVMGSCTLPTIAEIRVRNTMMRLLALVERCEHWTTAHVAAKFLRVMCLVLDLRPGQSRADVDKELVPLLIMANPCRRIMKFMSAQLAYLGHGCNLSSAQQVLCKETIRMMPVMTRLSFSDDADIQADCVEKVIVNVLPLDSLCIIFHTFIYEMQMTVRSSHGTYTFELFVKSTMQRQGMREIGTYILSVVLHSLLPQSATLAHQSRQRVRGHGAQHSCPFRRICLGGHGGVTARMGQESLGAHPLQSVRGDAAASRRFFSPRLEYVSRMLVLTDQRVLIMERPKRSRVDHVCTEKVPAKFSPMGPVWGDMSMPS